jgi:hypothetical protein
MHLLFRTIKFLFFIPICILASPGLAVLAITILLVEQDGEPIRHDFFSDLKKHGFASGFSLFMQEKFIKNYKNNIQGFVIGAAAFLVVSVGLRSLNILPVEIVYVALGVEFMLLLVYGTSMYFTVGEKSEGDASLTKREGPEILAGAMKELATHVGQMNKQLHLAEAKLEQTNKLEHSMTQLRGKLDAIPTDPQMQREFNEKYLMAMRALADQTALLENRIRTTEGKFDNIMQINAALQTLSQKIELIVGDHISLRVRKEFEAMMAQISQRISSSR